jgi:hypothetical protein
VTIGLMISLEGGNGERGRGREREREKGGGGRVSGLGAVREGVLLNYCWH